MKNKKYLVIFLIISSLLSCRYQDPVHPSFITAKGLNDSFTSSRWHITRYIINGTESASSFKGYSIYFHSDNVLQIKYGKHNYKGKWFVSSDYGTDDSPPADVGFAIAFKTEEKLLINGNYDILKRTDNKLLLKNTSDSGYGPDLIEFQRLKN